MQLDCPAWIACRRWRLNVRLSPAPDTRLLLMPIRNPAPFCLLTLCLMANTASVAAAAPAAPPVQSTTMHLRENGQTVDITVAEGPASGGKRSVHYHVDYTTSAQCHAVFDGNAAFYSTADQAGDTSEALPNGEWADLNEFRDAGAYGLVTIDLDVNRAHPRFVSFDIAIRLRPCLAAPPQPESACWLSPTCRNSARSRRRVRLLSPIRLLSPSGFGQPRDLRERSLRLYDRLSARPAHTWPRSRQ